MMQRVELGRTGEELAAGWLTTRGFSIVARNWRHGRYEIDLIAARNGVLHFIEVKSRRSGAYGYPEESVNRKKLEHMLRAAAGWLQRWPAYRRVQYDVLAVTIKKTANPEKTVSPEKTVNPEFTLFEDVYL